MSVHLPAEDDRGLIVYAKIAGDSLWLGQGKSADKARANATFGREIFQSPDPKKKAFLPTAAWIAPTAVRLACEHLEIPLPEEVKPWPTSPDAATETSSEETA